VLPIELAKIWIPGTRKSSDRPAWMHSEDVVKLVESIPKDIYPFKRDDLITVAWLHDILEDGVKADGSPVTIVDLLEHHVAPLCARGVALLTRNKQRPRWEYYYRIAHEGTYETILVKVLDRCANLLEGSGTMDDTWWKRYCRDTRLDVLPLTTYISAPAGLDRWCAEQLQQALNTK
jgi:(p)ppGpp synthase/HD superfamily hydrolase